MLGPFTFTFTLESEEFEKSEKVGCGSLLDHDNNLLPLVRFTKISPCCLKFLGTFRQMNTADI